MKSKAVRRTRGRQKSLGDLVLILAVSFLYFRMSMAVGGWESIVMLLVGFLLLALAALRWGVDSRDHRDDMSERARHPDRL
jgi:hypothetical protein